MTKNRIKELLLLVPKNSPFFDVGFARIESNSRQQHAIDRELAANWDAKFGWHFIKAMVEKGEHLPPSVHEDYLRRAFHFEADLRDDPIIAEAVALDHPSNVGAAGVLKAYIVLEDKTFEEIGTELGVSPQAVAAYEQLFFNYRDRRDDGLYVRSIVNENGVLSELTKDYYEREDPTKLYMRSAWKNGHADVAWFAGIRKDNFSTQDTYESATQVESHIMSHASALMRNGFGNQRLPGLSAARHLIGASKMAGQQSQTVEQVGVSSIGDSIMGDLLAIAGPTVKAQLEERERLAKAQEIKQLDTSKN